LDAFLGSGIDGEIALKFETRFAENFCHIDALLLQSTDDRPYLNIIPDIEQYKGTQPTRKVKNQVTFFFQVVFQNRAEAP